LQQGFWTVYSKNVSTLATFNFHLCHKTVQGGTWISDSWGGRKGGRTETGTWDTGETRHTQTIVVMQPIAKRQITRATGVLWWCQHIIFWLLSFCMLSIASVSKKKKKSKHSFQYWIFCCPQVKRWKGNYSAVPVRLSYYHLCQLNIITFIPKEHKWIASDSVSVLIHYSLHA
jgi:hypothetical protein